MKAIKLSLVLCILLACALPGAASTGCADILNSLAGKAVGVVCFASPDLTTNNTALPPNGPTTLPNDSLPEFADGVTPLPTYAFTPITDRGVIVLTNAPTPAPAIPGVQVEGFFADDPAGQARFLLRFPDHWNGRLVVAGASGTRSEFNGDLAWSDYVLQKGYAYASQNKGVMNFHVTSASDASACRYNPVTPIAALPIHYYDVDPGKPFTQWTEYMLKAAQLAQHTAKRHYGKPARYTYAVGTSNGGYQVRRAIEAAPDLFDGGVDWEGTFIGPFGPTVLTYLAPALANYQAYAASGYDQNSSAAKAILAAGFPPDIVVGTGTSTKSLWGTYWAAYWEATLCQWQKRFDPTYDTYGSDGLGMTRYDYLERAFTVPGVFFSVAEASNTGKVEKPLITVAGTMDGLLPIKDQARAYEALVKARRKGNDDHRKAQYRLYEVQNGNHIEGYTTTFPQLQLIEPYAQKAFDLLVDHVEKHASLPPSQCIPRGGTILDPPAEPGHCTNLFVGP